MTHDDTGRNDDHDIADHSSATGYEPTAERNQPVCERPTRRPLRRVPRVPAPGARRGSGPAPRRPPTPRRKWDHALIIRYTYALVALLAAVTGLLALFLR